MSQLTATDRESPSSTQESSFLSLTEACRACERYGHVVDCESHDLRPDMYFHLAGNMLKPVQNQVYTSSTTSSEKHMLWHANILGENPDFISQIIKNLIRYSEDYICEEYAEHIEKALENCDVHVYRECRFICEIIESLQKGRADDMLELLRRYNENNQKDLFNICAKDIRYARLFSLLSMIFLKKTTDGRKHGFYIEILDKPILLSQSSIIEQLSLGDEGSFYHTNDLISSFSDSQISNATARFDDILRSIPYDVYDDTTDFDEPAVIDKP